MEEEVGLLGRITGGLRGLLDNPFVQGVGGALAFATASRKFTFPTENPQ